MENHKLTAAQVAISAAKYKRANKREFPPDWYDWQMEGFAAEEPQVMTLAGNRSGKTMSAGYHFSVDVTGRYPDWWPGYQFMHPVNSLAMGVDNTQLKDVVQQTLLGECVDRHFGGGWIHRDEIANVEWSPQAQGLAKRVTIHGKYGYSYIALRPYSQTKTGTSTLSFAGTSLDRIWPDECPPDDLVGQLVTRTMTGGRGKGGRITYTMTPELGVTNLVKQFMEDRTRSQRLIGPVGWDQCPHLTPELQEQILSGIPEHERDMRSKGVPFFGSGLVYPIAESRIKCEPFEINQRWWKVLRAIDLGINHPTALCWLAYDPEADIIYLTRTYAQAGEAAAVHAAAANSQWAHARCVFPPDVDQTEKGSGKTVRHYYEKAGLKRTLDFENPDGTIRVEPGIFEIYERMRTGRLKVFSTCAEFWREFRLYHRSDGKLVKKNDDVMDAFRYGATMIVRHGSPLEPSFGGKPKTIRMADGRPRIM